VDSLLHTAEQNEEEDGNILDYFTNQYQNMGGIIFGKEARMIMSKKKELFQVEMRREKRNEIISRKRRDIT